MAKKRRPKRQRFKQPGTPAPSTSKPDARDDDDDDDVVVGDEPKSGEALREKLEAASVAIEAAKGIEGGEAAKGTAGGQGDATGDAKTDAKVDAKTDAKDDEKSAAKTDAKADRSGAQTDAKADAKSGKADATTNAMADAQADKSGAQTDAKSGKAGTKADASATKGDAKAGKADATTNAQADAKPDKNDAKGDAAAAKLDGKAGAKADKNRRKKEPIPEAIVRSERTKGAAKRESVADEVAPAVAAREPVFWFGFEVAWAKLAASRFIIFILLALDAVLQLSHAPRYGAGGFNVGQLPFLDELGPDRVLFGAGQLVLGYVFVLVAFGVATRVLVPVGAAIYAWLYFGSQLDSYQHHYLVALVLLIACFVPWERPADATPSTPVRAWAVRLLLVQLAIMYVWAAISKMDPTWVDGTTLSKQMTGTTASLIRDSIGFKVASVLVIAAELALASTVWTRRGWKIAAPLGLAFHFGIVFTGLEIGLFAFLMVGIYALVIPDRAWVAVVEAMERVANVLRKPSWIAFGVGVALTVAIASLVRFEDGFAIAAATCIVPLGVAIYVVLRGQKAPMVAVGVAHVLAIGLWLLVDRATSTTTDYYRFWGGSQRRIGSPAVAERAYRRLIEVEPENEAGHYQLGKLLVKRGAIDDALAHFREAQRLEPAKARAFVEEARVLVQQGKTAEALEKAKQGTYADPSNTEARAMVDSLQHNRPAKPQAQPDDTE